MAAEHVGISMTNVVTCHTQRADISRQWMILFTGDVLSEIPYANIGL